MSNPLPRLLIVEDDPTIAGNLFAFFETRSFAVDAASLPADVEVTHINLNDHTVAGLRHKTLPVFSVQYHPESAPGPHDSEYLFERFIDLMAK